MCRRQGHAKYPKSRGAIVAISGFEVAFDGSDSRLRPHQLRVGARQQKRWAQIIGIGFALLECLATSTLWMRRLSCAISTQMCRNCGRQQNEGGSPSRLASLVWREAGASPRQAVGQSRDGLCRARRLRMGRIRHPSNEGPRLGAGDLRRADPGAALVPSLRPKPGPTPGKSCNAAKSVAMHLRRSAEIFRICNPMFRQAQDTTARIGAITHGYAPCSAHSAGASAIASA